MPDAEYELKRYKILLKRTSHQPSQAQEIDYQLAKLKFTTRQNPNDSPYTYQSCHQITSTSRTMS